MSVITASKLLGLQLLPGFGQRAGRLHPVAFAQQRELVERAQVRLVVDDQDLRRRGGWTAASGGYCVKWGAAGNGAGCRARKCTKNSLPSRALRPRAGARR